MVKDIAIYIEGGGDTVSTRAPFRAGMAELCQTTPQNTTLHVGAIYGEGELEEQVRPEGARRVQRMVGIDIGKAGSEAAFGR